MRVSSALTRSAYEKVAAVRAVRSAPVTDLPGGEGSVRHIHVYCKMCNVSWRFNFMINYRGWGLPTNLNAMKKYIPHVLAIAPTSKKQGRLFRALSANYRSGLGSNGHVGKFESYH